LDGVVVELCDELVAGFLREVLDFLGKIKMK